jgi:hypothetical protein
MFFRTCLVVLLSTAPGMAAHAGERQDPLPLDKNPIKDFPLLGDPFGGEGSWGGSDCCAVCRREPPEVDVDGKKWFALYKSCILKPTNVKDSPRVICTYKHPGTGKDIEIDKGLCQK